MMSAWAAGVSTLPWPPGRHTPFSIRSLPRASMHRRPSSLRSPELCGLTAIEMAARLARKEVSAREVMSAHLAQIERINPKLNAMVTLVPEQAMAAAAKADETIIRRDPVGVLHGLPSLTRTSSRPLAFGRPSDRRSSATSRPTTR